MEPLLVHIPLFQFLTNGCQEAGADAAIYNPVIVTERQVHHMTNTNGITLRRFNNNSTLLDCTHRHDGHLWLADDGGAHQTAKSTYIG